MQRCLFRASVTRDADGSAVGRLPFRSRTARRARNVGGLWGAEARGEGRAGQRDVAIDVNTAHTQQGRRGALLGAARCAVTTRRKHVGLGRRAVPFTAQPAPPAAGEERKKTAGAVGMLETPTSAPHPEPLWGFQRAVGKPRIALITLSVMGFSISPAFPQRALPSARGENRDARRWLPCQSAAVGIDQSSARAGGGRHYSARIWRMPPNGSWSLVRMCCMA